MWLQSVVAYKDKRLRWVESLVSPHWCRFIDCTSFMPATSRNAPDLAWGHDTTFVRQPNYTHYGQLCLPLSASSCQPLRSPLSVEHHSNLHVSLTLPHALLPSESHFRANLGRTVGVIVSTCQCFHLLFRARCVMDPDDPFLWKIGLCDGMWQKDFEASAHKFIMKSSSFLLIEILIPCNFQWLWST